MRRFLCLPLFVVLSAMIVGAAEIPSTQNETIDRILAQEQVEVQLLRQYAPLVETYIQYVRPDKDLGEAPDGDKYFLGRARLVHGIELEALNRDPGLKHKMLGGLGEFFSMEFLPRGFLQMIYLDTSGFDRNHYKFEYIGREFLGEVRCLVFDVNPLPKAGKGRFVGRIWVEDEDYHIVRFNGIYGGASLTSNYFNFDSWRVNAGKNVWLPAFVYSEGPGVHDAKARSLGFKAFRAQTRLWGYDLARVRKEEELSKVVVERTTPVIDRSQASNDYSPAQAERSWDLMAEMNVADRLQRQGLVAPPGEVDRVLETVVNNIEITNNLEIEPEIHCRVLMTSTLESFTIGHTIVLSRGLIDVLPDEASLAALLAHELGHVVLRHHIDSQFAFFGQLRFEEKGTFRHFDFARTPEEEEAANQKGAELLRNSPYSDRSGSAQLFLQALRDRSKEVPNLVSPHLGNRVMTNWANSSGKPGQTAADLKLAANLTAALPVGGRIKVDPWNDRLTLLKTRGMSALAEDEKRPFQITPLVFYLTRQGESSSAESAGAATATLGTDLKP